MSTFDIDRVTKSPSRLLLSALVGATTLSILGYGCTTWRRERPAAKRAVQIACTVPVSAYVAQTTAALAQAGFTVSPNAPTSGLIEAARAAVYTGAGEGIEMNGPYRWTSQYANSVVAVSVQTVRVNPDGSVYTSATHDENSAPADRRHFLPVIQSLRQLCAGTPR